MSNKNHTVSGLAASIRTATESETFDLASQNASTITNTIQDAFSEPFPIVNTMIRLTFITGAGKQGRQKYDEGAAKAVSSTLQKLGFSEDRGASCVVECAGSFKLQHDTGKNLKTVVVFPNILKEAVGTVHASEEGTTSSSLLPADTPEYMIATSSVAIFSRMLTSKCPSWSQKKHCLSALEELNGQLATLDAKLVRGSPLDRDEQAFYDLVSDLDGKESHVRTELHTQVEDGRLTEEELSNVVIPHNAERVAALQKEVNADIKNKKAKNQLEKTQARKKMLRDLNPTSPAPLRYEATLRKLRKELLPILEMRLESKKLRSMRETQFLSRQEELQEEIMELEGASRGWFEDSDAFDRRVGLSRASFAATQKSKASKKSYSSAAGAGKTIASSKWILPGDANKGQAGNNQKKKKKRTGGAIFAAMMIESDSDDDDHDEEDDSPPPSRSRAAQPDIPTVKVDTAAKPASGGGGGTKKNKKKSKNKKKNNQNQSEEGALNEVLATKQKKENEVAKAKQEVANPYFDFVRNVLLPGVAAVLAWLVTLVFGKPKSSKKKRKNE